MINSTSHLMYILTWMQFNEFMLILYYFNMFEMNKPISSFLKNNSCMLYYYSFIVSPVWVLMCLFKSDGLSKPFAQTSQNNLYGFFDLTWRDVKELFTDKSNGFKSTGSSWKNSHQCNLIFTYTSNYLKIFCIYITPTY